MWYSAIGSRKAQTLPSTFAAATHVRSIAAASSGRAGDAITSPGMSRSTATESSLWKWPPKPFWYPYPAIRTTIPLRYWPCEKNCSVAASPRSWSSALWR